MNLPALPGVSIALIKRIVCDRYGLAPEVMASPSRKHDHSHPRQLAMRLSREFTGKSFHTIGRYFGGRDHTTIIHAIRATERRNQRSEYARRVYAELRAALELIAPKPAEVNMPDLYAELGLQPGATPEEIKAAHRRQVREHHPDRGGDTARFQLIQLAYDTLKDEHRRKRYDDTGETAGATNDPAIQMLGMIIENLIGQMLQDGAPIERLDMRKMAIDAVENKKREIGRERAQAERAIAKARDLQRRWKRKHKAKGPDLVGDSLRRRERDLQEATRRMGEVHDAWARAGKLLDDYEYRFDEKPAWASSSSTGGTGFHFVQLDLGSY